MKAVVFEQYGPPEVLSLEEVEIPVPKNNEVLVKVQAASVNYVDWQVLSGKSLMLRIMSGLFKPKKNILGDDVAGIVDAVGEDVKLFQPGDEVFGLSNYDAFAEYASVPEKDLAMKPAGITFEQAAAIPEAGITALQGIRDKGKIEPGQKVLINGASGGVGTYAVQFAKYFGAEVTGVCSTEKIDMVRSIGADHVIDYRKKDFTKSQSGYDLIFAVGGNHSIFDYKRVLNPDGVYVCVGGSASQYFEGVLLGPILTMLGNKKFGSMYSNPNNDDYVYFADLVETGKIIPVIDKTFTLSEVPEALRYFGSGDAQGKIVISINKD